MEHRHFFMGRIYTSPKKKEDPSFVKADDFTAEELSKINVSELAFKWEHNPNVTIGKFITSLQAKDGSTFVIGYVDTSTPVGRLMADAMKSKVLNGLSMAHDIKVFLNSSTNTLRYQKDPIEISLVDVADREGCQIFHNASTNEIQNSIPILTKELSRIESQRIFSELEQRISNYFNKAMSSAAAAPTQAASTPINNSQQMPAQSGDKRPLENGNVEATSSKIPRTSVDSSIDETKALLANLRPEITSKLTPEQVDQLMVTLGAKLSQLQEDQSRLRKYEQERISKEAEHVRKIRDGLFESLRTTIKDPKELESVGTQLTSIFDRTLQSNNPDTIQSETKVFDGILAHTNALREQNEAQLKKIADLEEKLTRTSAESQLRAFTHGFSRPTPFSEPLSSPYKLPPLPTSSSSSMPASNASSSAMPPTPMNNNNNTSTSRDDDLMNAILKTVKSANPNPQQSGIITPPTQVEFRRTGGVSFE